MFFSPDDFPFLQAMSARWREIRAEFEAVAAEVAPWPTQEMYRGAWDVYGLYDFPHGEPLPAHIARCPITAALIARHVPQHGAAGFSVLGPGAELEPHEGYQGPFLRAHLGLSVPPGDCGLRVQLTTRRWQEGHWLVFDDRLEHEAWNRSAQARVVLLLDFIKR